METNSSVLIPLARIIKRHTFKENKWKALSYSGAAAAWYAKVQRVYINSILTPLRIEVPHLNTAEFFVYFEGDYEPTEKAELSIERREFPPLEGSDFYVCDLMGAEVQSALGLFKVESYYENGDPSKGVTSINLKVLSLFLHNGKTLELEVPLSFFKQRENSWFLEDVELWMNHEED